MAEGTISTADPRSAELRRLLERHLAFAHEQMPPEDRHALDVDGLTNPSVTFYGLRIDERLLADAGLGVRIRSREGPAQSIASRLRVR